MGLKELMEKAKNIIANRKSEPEVYYDNETRDKYLRSLRRERRIQLEQREKEILKKKIEAFKVQERRENLYGIGNNILKTKANLMGKSKGRRNRKSNWF